MKINSRLLSTYLLVTLLNPLQVCNAVPWNPVRDALDAAQSSLGQLEEFLFGSPPRPKKQRTLKSETYASCIDNKFACHGSDKEYCREQEKLCNKKKPKEPKQDSCHPECHWTCEEQKCEKACAPKCAPPVCQTRCKGFNTQSCHIKCEKPSCAVICPKSSCSERGCVKCTTQCSQPNCNLACGKDLQNCHNVCAEPLCNWQCTDPKSCPKPKCEMKCKEPRNCLTSSIHRQLPPLQPGETQVTNFQASLNSNGNNNSGNSSNKSFLQFGHGLAKVRINVTSMGLNNSIESREVELAVSRAADDKDAKPWTSKIARFVNGSLMRSAASCVDGNFQCEASASQDDQAWCAEQQSIVCRGDKRRSFMQVRSSAHSVLQP